MNYIPYNVAFNAILHVTGSAAGDVVAYTIYDHAGATFASGTPTFIASALWKISFTPTVNNETYIVVLVDTTTGTTVTETYEARGVVGTIWDATSGAVGSSVGISNIALSKIGAQRITSFSENTENARLLNAIYGTIRDEVLRAHPWNFAIKRTAPALAYTLPSAWGTGTTYVAGDYALYSNYPYKCLVGHVAGTFATDLAAAKWVADTTDWIPYEYSYSHSIPSDCLRVISVTTGETVIEDFKIEGGKILSDYDVIYIKYIYRVTDSTAFDANFISCFATRLASECCFPLTGKADLALKMREMYTEELRLAKGIDGQESGMPDQINQDTFLNSRI